MCKGKLFPSLHSLHRFKYHTGGNQLIEMTFAVPSPTLHPDKICIPQQAAQNIPTDGPDHPPVVLMIGNK